VRGMHGPGSGGRHWQSYHFTSHTCITAVRLRHGMIHEKILASCACANLGIMAFI
jgi:hypothetical protein